MMKNIFIFGVLIILLFIPSVVFAHVGHVHIAIGGDDTAESEMVDKLIDDLTKKIAAAQSEERTLSSQIAVMNDQIKLTTLRITETGDKIKKLESEVAELGTKIGLLEESLTELTNVLLERIVSTYKVRKTSFLTYLFGSDSIGDFVRRSQYIATAQENDKRVLFEVQEAKTVYGEQKNLREQKKQEQEVLKGQLEVQSRQLDGQKREKQNLLDQTKSDEAEYQRLLQNALAEKNALEAAIVSGVQVGPVKKGDAIALVGNTGYPYCSTGAHLHFEVRKNNTWVNPGDYMGSKTVIDDQNGGNTTIGSGSWDWPLEGDIRITQHYGKTPYSWRYAYSGGIHTGIDMVSKSSSIIKAPADGTLYTSSQNCSGATIKIKYIEHGDGVISFYLHVQ